MANQASSHVSIINILMVNTKYFETACLGGYQDTSIVNQFQFSNLFRIKTILKFMVPVIFLNLYYTGSFHTCEIISWKNRRNNFHFLLECQRFIMICVGKCCKQSVGLLMYMKCFFYMVIVTYQIQIMNLYSKLSTDIFIKLKGFHLEINTFSRHNWNYCALCIEIVLSS